MDFAQFLPSTTLRPSIAAYRQYEHIIGAQPSASPLPRIAAKVRARTSARNRRPTKTIPFSEIAYFRAATSDDIATLRTLRFAGNDVNSTDQFGWTALMMAACAGASQSVNFLLLQPRIDCSVRDKQRRSAWELAADRGHSQIAATIRAHLQRADRESRSAIVITDSEDETPEATAPPQFFCPDCARSFAVTTEAEHTTSILHRFNIRGQLPRLAKRYALPDSNRGFQLMLKQGWDRETGLGPAGEGVSFPVKTTLRRDRRGLGAAKAEPARITHFAAMDVEAVRGGGKRRAEVRTVAMQTKRQVRYEERKRRREERRLRAELA